jgi:50S ribosomal protein L16 3-hydroxylase
VRDFLGSYLTEPKSHIFFDPPAKPLGEARFAAAVARRGIRLDARSQLLFADDSFYLNGESVAVARRDRVLLRQLADERALPAQKFGVEAVALLHDWYRCGFVQLP